MGTDDFAPGATFSSASFARFAAGVTPIHSPRSSFTGNAPGGLPMEKRFFSFRAASATTLAALASRVTLRSTRAGEAAEGPPATPPIPRTGSPSGRMLREPRVPLWPPPSEDTTAAFKNARKSLNPYNAGLRAASLDVKFGEKRHVGGRGAPKTKTRVARET